MILTEFREQAGIYRTGTTQAPITLFKLFKELTKQQAHTGQRRLGF
jgi:hypothetical protein